MGFDATKLVVGRKYRQRDGGVSRYLGEFKGPNGFSLAWAAECGEIEVIRTTTKVGVYGMSAAAIPSDYDIISCEEIKDPVEVKLATRFISIWRDGTTGGGYHTMEAAIKSIGSLGTDTIGVYELPATIFVTPK